MEKLKQVLLICSILGMIFLIVFVPGILIEQKDKEKIGEIYVEEISAGRNALLTSLSLEERIELYCSSAVTTVMMFDSVGSSSLAVSDKENRVSLEYSYQIEEKEVLEEFSGKIEQLVEEDVLPKIVLPKENTALSGVRFYLYSEENDYGAVFTCMEQVIKNDLMAKFIVDEESGKIIAFYFRGDLVGKVADSLQEYGSSYMAYLGFEYEQLEQGRKEQIYKIGENFYMYYLYSDSYEWMIYPTS